VKPLVSILIPAYNAGAWIGDTIKSAIAQTWTRKEVILVDDGSTDRTLEIARHFASKNISITTQSHQGASAARNHAFSLSQGDYIQWLDADDLLSPDKITNQMEVVEKCKNPRILFSSGWASFAYRIDSADLRPTSLWCDLSPVEWLIRKIAQNLHMQTATWLTSRELTEAAGPWDIQLGCDDDGEYFCRVLLASRGVRFVPGGGVFYRVRPSSRLSHIGYSDKKKGDQLSSMKLHVKYIRSLEDSDRVRAACITYLQNWLSVFYPERPDMVAELEALAVSLGGRLEKPQLGWKYAWIKDLFGWGAAKRVQIELPQFRLAVVRAWDKAMYDMRRSRV
jgi:glycosyltransferase involved in cell wall biosynthesis